MVAGILNLAVTIPRFITPAPSIPSNITANNLNNTNIQQVFTQIASMEIGYFEESIILTSIVGVINIIGLIILRSGFNILSKTVSNEIGIGNIGIIVYIVSYPLIVIGLLLNLFGFLSVNFVEILASLPALFIAIILLIVGSILVGVGIYRVGREYSTNIVKVGGILIAIVIPAFIGSILSYIGLRNVKPITERAREVQIYSIGGGVIKGDGSAQILIYSSVSGSILSVKIEGMNIFTFKVNPATLQPGNNQINIQFDNVSNLVKGSTYIITLLVDVNGNAIEVKTYALYQP